MKVVLFFGLLMILQVAGSESKAIVFDPPPTLSPYFIADVSWVDLAAKSWQLNGTGSGKVFFHGSQGQMRITGKTTWSDQSAYTSDTLSLCTASVDSIQTGIVEVYPPQSNSTVCQSMSFAAAVGLCSALGNGQLPQAGFLRHVTWNGSPALAYVYPWLAGVGGLSSATFYFTPNGEALIGLSTEATSGYTTNANLFNIQNQAPPASTFSTPPFPCSSS